MGAYWIPASAFILLVLGWAFWFLRYKLAARRKAEFDAQMIQYSRRMQDDPEPGDLRG
jgi:hypothetical protein